MKVYCIHGKCQKKLIQNLIMQCIICEDIAHTKQALNVLILHCTVHNVMTAQSCQCFMARHIKQVNFKKDIKGALQQNYLFNDSWVLAPFQTLQTHLQYVSADVQEGHPNPFISYLLSSAIHADCNFMGQRSVRSDKENESNVLHHRKQRHFFFFSYLTLILFK